MSPDKQIKIEQTLRRMILREFLLEPDLYREVGLDRLPAQLGGLLGCPAERAISGLLAGETLDATPLESLEPLFAIRDMALVSRTASSLAVELKQPEGPYERCCRTALCYGVARMTSHVYAALRAAAGKDDSWARHHFLYGVILGLEGSRERALWELDMALRREPYEDARIRARQVISLLE